MVIEQIRSIMKKDKHALKVSMPKHIAITTDGIEKWALKNKIPYADAYRRSFLAIKNTIKTQVSLGIPILSFYISDKNIDRESEAYGHLLDAAANMLNDFANSELVNKNRIKISVLGKWYNLPGRAVESIKKAIEETGEYDSFFVNFCINYNGQEEIVDAFKILGMQIKSGKLDPELIGKDSIKENIYSSYFIPPDLMIRNGSGKNTSGFLLWDSVNAKLYFTSKLWPDFGKAELMDAIKDYRKGD